MRRVFADSLYWIALASPRDQWHRRATEASHDLHGAEVVTTEEVLTEFFAALRYNPPLRHAALAMYGRIESHPTNVIRRQSSQTFRDGLELYEARPDKRYSLVDCISMATMRRESITDVLTHDRDFAQEGFILLL